MTGNTAWFPFYIGDYQADTMHLSCEQHGAYFLLMLAYYRRGKALADDNAFLAGIAKLTPRKWREMRPVLAEFFKVGDDVWRHKRIDCEIAAQKARHEERRRSGANGAGSRWQHSIKSKPNGIAEPYDSHSNENAPDDAEPRPKMSRLTDQNPTKSTAKKCHTSQSISLPLTGQREILTHARDATPPLPSQGDGDAALRAVTIHKVESAAPAEPDPPTKAEGAAAFQRCIDALNGKLGVLDSGATVPPPPDPRLIEFRDRLSRLNTLAGTKLRGELRMQAWEVIAAADSLADPHALSPEMLADLDAIERLGAPEEWVEAAE